MSRCRPGPNAVAVLALTLACSAAGAAGEVREEPGLNLRLAVPEGWQATAASDAGLRLSGPAGETAAVEVQLAVRDDPAAEAVEHHLTERLPRLGLEHPGYELLGTGSGYSDGGLLLQRIEYAYGDADERTLVWEVYARVGEGRLLTVTVSLPAAAAEAARPAVEVLLASLTPLTPVPPPPGQYPPPAPADS